MRALDSEVRDTVWAAIESLMPAHLDSTRWAVTDSAERTGTVPK
jgi:hypothetical protein